MPHGLAGHGAGSLTEPDARRRAPARPLRRHTAPLRPPHVPVSTETRHLRAVRRLGNSSWARGRSRAPAALAGAARAWLGRGVSRAPGRGLGLDGTGGRALRGVRRLGNSPEARWAGRAR